MAKRIIPYTPRTPEQLEHAKRMKEASDVRIEEQKKKNEEYYKQLLDNCSHTLPFLLFHGTDAKMVGLNKEDRDSLFKIFHDVIDTL